MPVHVRQSTVSNLDQLQKDAGVSGASCPSYLGGTQPFQPYIGSKQPNISPFIKSLSFFPTSLDLAPHFFHTFETPLLARILTSNPVFLTLIPAHNPPLTMSVTNLFKRAERVQLEIPRDKIDWDAFKLYLERIFPYYRLHLNEFDTEGDPVRKKKGIPDQFTLPVILIFVHTHV